MGIFCDVFRLGIKYKSNSQNVKITMNQIIVQLLFMIECPNLEFYYTCNQLFQRIIFIPSWRIEAIFQYKSTTPNKFMFSDKYTILHFNVRYNPNFICCNNLELVYLIPFNPRSLWIRFALHKIHSLKSRMDIILLSYVLNKIKRNYQHF